MGFHCTQLQYCKYSILTSVDCAYMSILYFYRKCVQTALRGEVAKQLSASEMSLLNQQLSSLNIDVLLEETLCNVAYRTDQDNVLYYSRNYRRVKSRNSYIVWFKDAGSCIQFGQIEFFVSVSGKIFALVLKLEVQAVSCQEHFNISHSSLDTLSVSKIVPIVHGSGRLVCIPAANLICKCVFISIDDDLSKCEYVISFPNS